jgi:hypothetical protein
VTRQIIQIATTSWGDAQEMTPDLYALCNDGSVWNFILGPTPHWKRMPRIPQPEEVEEKRREEAAR